jgi:pimeloyl-ACP methyl ester carboxylesterase
MDYAGRFAHLSKLNAELVYDFFAMDSRGHGKSDGEFMFVPDVGTYTRDNNGFKILGYFNTLLT